MVDELIREIKVCLKNGCYMAALTIALTLPDICGKAQYPDEKSTKKRYVKWFDEYIKQCGIFPDNYSSDIPYLSSELIYSLRCSVLHEGNPGIDKEKSNIDYFELIWRERESASSTIFFVEMLNDDDGSDKCKKYSINLRYLCNLLCKAAENYYCNNKKLFSFFNYNINSMDFQAREIFRVGEEKQ